MGTRSNLPYKNSVVVTDYSQSDDPNVKKCPCCNITRTVVVNTLANTYKCDFCSAIVNGDCTPYKPIKNYLVGKIFVWANSIQQAHHSEKHISGQTAVRLPRTITTTKTGRRVIIEPQETLQLF